MSLSTSEEELAKNSIPMATAARIQLIYGDDPLVDVVEGDATQLMKQSAYLKLVVPGSQKIQVEIESPEMFVKYIVPYMMLNDEVVGYEDEEHVFRLFRDAELLGLRSLVGDLCRYLGRNLKGLLSHRDFRCRWISKDSLLEAMQYRMAFEGICLDSTECKEFHLGVLLCWLSDADAEECMAMNVWFGKRLECSWIELIENGLSDAEVTQQAEACQVFSRFFTQEDTNRLLLKSATGGLRSRRISPLAWGDSTIEEVEEDLARRGADGHVSLNQPGSCTGNAHDKCFDERSEKTMKKVNTEETVEVAQIVADIAIKVLTMIQDEFFELSQDLGEIKEESAEILEELGAIKTDMINMKELEKTEIQAKMATNGCGVDLKGYRICKLCENQISTVNFCKQACVGSTKEPSKHNGIWRKPGESKKRDLGHWTCCYSRDTISTHCQITLRQHVF